MALDLLIRGIDKIVGDGSLTADESMAVSIRKGAIASYMLAGVEEPSRHLSGKQVPPKWIVVRSDGTVEQVEQYCKPWLVDPQFTRESLNVTADRWRYTIVSSKIRASDNHGGMDENRSKGFMDAWAFTNSTYLPNRARGRNTVYGLATSRGLWRQLANSTFQELSYDEGTGVHVIRMDYSAVRPNRDVEVKAAIEEFATFVAQNSALDTIDFSMIRDDVFTIFEDDVKQRLENKIAARQFVLDPIEVDRIINVGGYDDIPWVQLTPNMLDVTNG